MVLSVNACFRQLTSRFCTTGTPKSEGRLVRTRWLSPGGRNLLPAVASVPPSTMHVRPPTANWPRLVPAARKNSPAANPNSRTWWLVRCRCTSKADRVAIVPFPSAACFATQSDRRGRTSRNERRSTRPTNRLPGRLGARHKQSDG